MTNEVTLLKALGIVAILVTDLYQVFEMIDLSSFPMPCER